MAGPQYTTNNPSSGISGFLNMPPGAPSASGAMPVQPMPGHLPTGNDGMQGGGFSGGPMGPLGNLPPGGGQPQMPPAQRPGMEQFQQRIGQLHPNTMNALRNIPPEALQQLHSAGMIHPGLMQHLNGTRAGGPMGPMTGEQR